LLFELLLDLPPVGAVVVHVAPQHVPRAKRHALPML
jgi:hypothetical protein